MKIGLMKRWIDERGTGLALYFGRWRGEGRSLSWLNIKDSSLFLINKRPR